MKIGFDLTIEQTQKLTMTPELIQAIQILQFNSQELESFVQEQLLVNPVLEQETPVTEQRDDWKEVIRNSTYDDSSYKSKESKDEDKSNDFERYVTNEVTLPEHLMFQFQFVADNKACRRVGKYIIESLDDNGYMTSTVEDIAKATRTSVEKVNEVLEKIHSFDPAGVGARDLKECLLIQLASRNQLTEDIKTMVMNHLEDIANNRLSALAKETRMSVIEVQKIADIIRTLEPKPGRQFAVESETRYIIPDVIVEKIDGEYQVSLNEGNTPHLMVSSYYKGLLGQSENDNQLSSYLSERVNSAMWLIKSIEQRKQTIYNVVTAVVKYQKDFFEYGNKYLKVLTLKDIAEEVGIHESTVSRSISGKYLQCTRGMFEIKHFFSAGVSTSGGDEISSCSVKEFIKELIEGEDPEKPLSDQKLVGLLESKGFSISRRTVAKYRDEMGVLASSKRKRY